MTHIGISDWVITSSRNGLSPVLHQATDWNNAVLQSIEPSGINMNQTARPFIQENAFENVFCKMMTILPRPATRGSSRYKDVVLPV